MKDNLITIVSALSIFYVCYTIFIYFYRDQIIFIPQASSYNDSAAIIKIPTPDGETLSSYYRPNPAAKYTVLISHGNVEDIGHLRPFVKLFHQQCFAIFAYDYRGYGTSSGSATVANSINDIHTVYQYLRTQLKVSPENILLFGRSLGTAPTVALAATEPVAGVILESSFLTAYRVMTRIPIFLFDAYPNVQLITKVTAPLLLIHGTDDEVISFYHGKHMYAAANEPKRHYWITGGGHNNLLFLERERYWQQIVKFVDELVASPEQSRCRTAE